MKRFCESLREHVKNIAHYKKKKMLPLTKEELKSHQDAKVCYICEKRILQKLPKNKNYRKLEIIAITQVNIAAQQIVFDI